jgi:4'-phosphopantetheinyl transferase EntD
MFEDLLPEGFIVECGHPRDPGPEPLPAESALVAHAVEKRRDEFRKGRQCARAALERMSIRDFALLHGLEREPLWPEGVVGSITHTDELCAVAVGWAGRYASVGIDAEEALPIEPAVAERVASRMEMKRLGTMSELLVARLVFSAKEAFYKCQFQLTHQWLDFRDVKIELAPGGGFTAELLVNAHPLTRGKRVNGRWCTKEGLLLTAIWLLPEIGAR